MAIQASTGSGVVGPIDVMGPQDSARQRRCTGRAGLVLGLVGGLGLGCAFLAWVVAGWAGPEASLRPGPGGRARVETRLVCLTCPLLGWVAGWAGRVGGLLVGQVSN